MSKEIVTDESRMQTLYIDLNKACTVSDYDKVTNIANKILKKFPGELKAFHCKVISMMQLEKFEASLKVLNENQDFAKELLFEKAYCEYRLNRLDEAILTTKGANANDFRIQELLGQILYKQEQYEDALEKYKYLMRNVPDAYEEERVVNMTAVVTAMAQWTKKKIDFPNVPENMFELSLNKACYLAASNKYEEAIAKLKEAEEMCLHTFEGDQDVTAAEIDEELSVIRVQQAYCLQKLNKPAEASVIYHDTLKKRCGDSQVLAVAANNVVCINKDQNIFDSRKKIKIASCDSVRQKLISGQRQEIALNQLLFQYYSNQGDNVKTVADQMLAVQPKCTRAALIKAAQFVKDKQVVAAIKFLEEYLEVIEKTDIDEEDLVKVQLTLAQLNLMHCSVSRCNEILGDLPIGYRHRFGVLGTRVSLCVMTEDIQAALDCLETAADWYKAEAAVLKKGSKEKDARGNEYETLLRTAASLAMRHKMAERAAGFYEQLLQRRSGDQSVLASLIAAYSRYDRSLAEKYIVLLKDEKQLPEVDVDSLESAFIFGAKHMKKMLKGEVTPSTKSGEKTPEQGGLKHRRRHRKTRLPKNYDSSRMPDPERWVPKRERAHYRGKKRDKRNATNQFRGPQGATAGSVELDASKKVSAPATPSVEPVHKGAVSSASGAGAAAATSASGAAATATSATQKAKASAAASKKSKSKKKGGKW